MAPNNGKRPLQEPSASNTSPPADSHPPSDSPPTVDPPPPTGGSTFTGESSEQPPKRRNSKPSPYLLGTQNLYVIYIQIMYTQQYRQGTQENMVPHLDPILITTCLRNVLQVSSLIKFTLQRCVQGQTGNVHVTLLIRLANTSFFGTTNSDVPKTFVPIPEMASPV